METGERLGSRRHPFTHQGDTRYGCRDTNWWFTFEFDGRAKELRKRHWPWVVGIGKTERNTVSVAAFIALRHYVTVTLGRKDLSFRRAPLNVDGHGNALRFSKA